MSSDEEKDEEFDEEFDDEFDDEFDNEYDDENDSASFKKKLVIGVASAIFIGILIYNFSPSSQQGPTESDVLDSGAAVAPDPGTPEPEIVAQALQEPEEAGSMYDPSQKKPPSENKTEPPEKEPESEQPEPAPKPEQTELQPLAESSPVEDQGPNNGAVGTVDKFTIQVGTYVLKESFVSGKRILKKMGMEPERRMGKMSITRYNVQVGDFQDVEEMQNIVKILASDGIDVQVQMSKTGTYSLSALENFNRKKAFDKRRELILKGYPAKVIENKKRSPVFILRTGRFATRGEAEQVVKKLKKNGLDGIVKTL